MVGCFRKVPAHIERAWKYGHNCSVLRRQQVLTASKDRIVKVWSAASGECLLTLQGHGDDFNSAMFSADDHQVLTASTDQTAKVWSATSGSCLLTLTGHGRWVNSAVFSDDGQQVLTASNDRTAKVWSAASGKCLLTLSGRGGWVNSAVFSAEGQHLQLGREGWAPAHLGRSRLRRLFCGLR